MFTIDNTTYNIFVKDRKIDKSIFDLTPKVVAIRKVNDEQGRIDDLITLEVYCVVNQRQLINSKISEIEARYSTKKASDYDKKESIFLKEGKELFMQKKQLEIAPGVKRVPGRSQGRPQPSPASSGPSHNFTVDPSNVVNVVLDLQKKQNRSIDDKYKNTEILTKFDVYSQNSGLTLNRELTQGQIKNGSIIEVFGATETTEIRALAPNSGMTAGKISAYTGGNQGADASIAKDR